jgi:regulator of protease activity HflC (stomatin/prohibitin superfamily)
MTEPVTTLNASREAAAGGFSGYLALLLMLAFLGYGIWSLVGVISGGDNAAATDFIGLIGSLFLFFLLSAGFYMIQPNQGVAITLFGAYKGTDRNEGLRWVWPWMGEDFAACQQPDFGKDQGQ